MLNKHYFLTVMYLSLLYNMGTAFAQNKSTDISQIKFLYEELRFEEATQFGQKLLEKDDSLSEQHLEYIHQYLAFSFYNIGKTDSARVHFLSLLSITPEKELDPLKTSPKIIDFFNHTKNTFQEVNSKTNIISYPKYIFIEDKRPNAAWRSALLPGWGQYYKGQKARSYFFGGGFLTSAIIFSLATINEKDYEQKYLKSIHPDDISNNYDKFNTWSKVRRISLYTSVSIWLFSFFDALWTDYNQIELTPFKNSNTVALTIQYAF